MLLAVRISSYGCTSEVWRALKKLELHSAIASCNSYASFVLSKLPACIHLTIIPRARVGSESIAHEAEGRMGY